MSEPSRDDMSEELRTYFEASELANEIAVLLRQLPDNTNSGLVAVALQMLVSRMVIAYESDSIGEDEVAERARHVHTAVSYQFVTTMQTAEGGDA